MVVSYWQVQFNLVRFINRGIKFVKKIILLHFVWHVERTSSRLQFGFDYFNKLMSKILLKGYYQRKEQGSEVVSETDSVKIVINF